MTSKRSLRPIIVASCTALAFTALNAFAADDPAKTNWVHSIAAGGTLTSGNSDSIRATLVYLGDRKWEQDEVSLGADGAYGRTHDYTTTPNSDTKSAELVHGFVQYNHLFTDRLYAYGRVDALHDGVALIHYRVTLSPGAGYYLIKEKATDLALELGPGYVWDDVGGVTRHFATIRVGDKFHHQLSDRARIWQTAEWLPDLDDFNNYIMNAEIGIEADISTSKKLSLRSYIDDTYNSQPAAGRKQNDVRWVTAIAYKF